jgi:hypothetical protein
LCLDACLIVVRLRNTAFVPFPVQYGEELRRLRVLPRRFRLTLPHAVNCDQPVFGLREATSACIFHR